jgi:hypothetical protein
MKMLFYMLLLLVGLSFGVSGQTKYDETNFIGLFVYNLDSSLAWYRTKLEFEIIDTVNNNKNEYRFALLSWNQTLIEMIEHPKIISNKQIKECYPDNLGSQGFFKLGFYIEDLESLQYKLKSKNENITYPILKAEGFSRKLKLFIIEDYEGNMIQFYNFIQ